ncbi:amidohydrolase family protein [Croceicoccus ponticola]|uniref:amidohydrolase family protein n=1 Tax=Croceicoccus ponticola TaxID=2217664 RepID=UPI001F0C3C3A|nr:amidohydrolase family protein [Croceicoccus ponticola]
MGKTMGPGPVRGVTLREGTNFAVALSPDGRTIAFDLLGILWTVPARGGAARMVTDAFADLAWPCWSPDGSWIACQSYRSGNFHIWTFAPDGGEARQLTRGFHDFREPFYAADGRHIYCSSDLTGRYAIHRIDVATGEITAVACGEGQCSEPCLSADGSRIAWVRDGQSIIEKLTDGTIRSVASVSVPHSGSQTVILAAPSYLPDGTLTYVRIVDQLAERVVVGALVIAGQDMFPFRADVMPDGALLYSGDGRIRKIHGIGEAKDIPFEVQVPISRAQYVRKPRDFTSPSSRPAVGIAAPALSPDGKQVVFCALNDVYLLDVGDPVPRKIASGPSHKSYPAWSPDGRSIAYASDRDGAHDLWLHDLASGEDRRLTRLSEIGATMCCWSGDGKQIAFLDHAGALHLLTLADGSVRKIYDALWLPGRPSFGPGGRHIAYAAFKPISARFREGLSEVLVVVLDKSTGTYQPIMSERSLATRGVDGPVWSPDGKWFAYVFASCLWVQPVGPDGRFAGEPRQLADDVADAPSWNGLSDRLLYLSEGKLRIVELVGAKPVPVPLRLTWALPAPARRKVIRAERLWDGQAPEYRRADVVIEGNRISAVAPFGAVDDAQAQVVAADGLTLMPGLIDMHTHRCVHGYAYGRRFGLALLAMGITSTRSPGGAAYEIIEDREATDAGLRLAPRHFVTGEALDGGRIYYNFMRPVTEPGQLDREMARAEALGYDMIKTYVRMDHATQAEVIARSHLMGMPTSSHYHYPSLRQGGDCTEHMGATNRFGFSRTVTALGRAYEDVSKLFAAAQAGRTPTLFSARALLPDYPDLVADQRVRTLLPPWDLARLDALVEWASENRASLLAMLEANVAQIRAMMDNGWHVHTGTDAPIDTIGISYHLNLRAMTRFGLSPYEALLTATAHAADFLGEPLGVIAPGKLADLILVKGDPLADVVDAANVRHVLRDGEMHSVDALLEPYGQGPSAGAAPPVALSSARTDDYFWHQEAYVEACRASCCSGHAVSHA